MQSSKRFKRKITKEFLFKRSLLEFRSLKQVAWKYTPKCRESGIWKYINVYTSVTRLWDHRDPHTTLHCFTICRLVNSDVSLTRILALKASWANFQKYLWHLLIGFFDYHWFLKGDIFTGNYVHSQRGATNISTYGEWSKHVLSESFMGFLSSFV